MEKAVQWFEETSFERDCRSAAKFHEVEIKLPKRWATSDLSLTDKLTSVLGSHNPFAQAANPHDNHVWLLDNTAYRPVHPYPHAPQPWQAEFVACFFKNGRRDLGECVSAILDQVGLDGKVGSNDEIRQRIEQRIQPFVDAIAPARMLEIQMSHTSLEPEVRNLGPSNGDGISSDMVLTGGSDAVDGTTVEVTNANNVFPSLLAKCHYAGPEGWAVISDIDDTIKITQTPDPIGTLRTTFTEIPRTTAGMPEFYRTLHAQLENPTWFYLSASPYNLYPFLHKFLPEHYPHGTIILRENSWMYFSGLLQSLTQGVQAYKVSRMMKIHDWLPQRKIICVGDSTQSDPEAYAQIYKKYPGWVHAIFIRKVTDAPFMETKNKPERFTKAFEGVPESVYEVFTDPAELNGRVQQIASKPRM